MAQLPKFVVYKDEKDEIRWRLEAHNAEINGISAGSYQTKDAAVNGIKDHIAAAIGASGVSVSLGTEYEPIVEYEGFEQPMEEPGPDDVTSEEPIPEGETED